MPDDNQEILTDKDHELFLDIAKDIHKNPARYGEAGKWLHEYCSEDAYWQRQETELKELQRKEKEYPVLGNIQRVEQFEEKMKEKRTPAMLVRFQEARDYLLEKYKDQQFVPEEDAQRIILITWLLTDPDAEKANLKITDLEKWPWEPMDDITKMSRSFAAYSWSHGGGAYSPWIKLARVAWGKVRVREQNEVPSANSHRLVGEIWNVFGVPIHVRNLFLKLNCLRGWKRRAAYVGICLLVGLLLAAVTASLWIPLVQNTTNPVKDRKAQTEAKTNGDLSPAIITTGPNSPVTINYDTSPIGNTYRPLSPELRIAMISDLKAIRKIDSKLGMKIFIDTESGNSNRQHLEEELVSIIAAAGFAVHGSGNSTILRGRTVPPVEILVNTAHIKFAERFSRVIRPLINTNIALSKSESFSEDSLKIFVRGEPLFSRDGVVTFR